MIPEMVLHFEVIDEIGRGGMGIVYKARDTKLGRLVALKVVSDTGPSSNAFQSFLAEEARAASALNHPNILTVYEIGEEGGRIFIVTEFIEGTTLRALLQTKGLEVGRALNLGRQIASGLAQAHAKGIVHRDIKPENVMVTPDFRAKIMDFGVARSTSGSSLSLRPGTILGTLPYISPEQLGGKPADARSDVFSLGVVLYEMVAGRKPFDAEYEAAAVYAIANADPVPLEEQNPSLAPDIINIVNRCLEKNAEKRYKNAEELESALRSAIEVTSRYSPAQTVRDAGVVFPSRLFERRTGPFVGRGSERRLVAHLLDEVAKGKGKVLIVRGEAGVGKTALIAEALHRPKQGEGPHLLWGRCLFGEAAVPYQPLVSALKPVFEVGGPNILASLTEAAQTHGLQVEGLQSLMRFFLGLGSESNEIFEKEMLWDAIVLLAEILSLDRPLALVLDDLQWADRSTMALFEFMARNLQHSKILLVGLARSGPVEPGKTDAGMHVTASLRQLNADGLTREVALTRFSREETGELIGGILDGGTPSAELIETLYVRSDGNPMFAVELTGMMKKQGNIKNAGGNWEIAEGSDITVYPTRLQDLVRQRLDRLSEEERGFLEVAACEGIAFKSDVIAASLRVDRIPLLRKLQSLERDHGLVHNQGKEYRFDSSMVRQVLYDDMLPELRVEYHRAIASWLKNRFGNAPEHASAIAQHLSAAGDDVEALEYILAAADNARSLCSFDEAAQLYTKARLILDRTSQGASESMIRVLEGLGECSFYSGKTREARAHFDSMTQAAREMRNRRSTAAALCKSGNCHRILGEIPSAFAKCAEGISIAADVGDENIRLECLHSIALAHIARGEYDRAREVSTDSLAAARKAGNRRMTALSLGNIGAAELHAGNYNSAIARLEEALALQEHEGSGRDLATTLNFLGLVYHRTGRFSDGLKASFRSLEIKQRFGDAAAIPGTLNLVGDLYRDCGLYNKGRDYHQRGLALARQNGNRGSECDNLRDLAADSLAVGEIAAARQFLEQVLDISRRAGYTWYETRAYITFGELHVALAEISKAVEYVRKGLDLARTIGAGELIMEALWKLSLAEEQQGEPANGSQHLKEAIALAKKTGHELFLWQMNFDLARLAERLGKGEEAVIAREEAMEQVGRILGRNSDEEVKKSFGEKVKVCDRSGNVD
jgi:tetratricopeptide (TPR) repeat protein